MSSPPIRTFAEAKAKLIALGFSDQERGQILALLQTQRVAYEVFDDSDAAIKSFFRAMLNPAPAPAPAPTPTPSPMATMAPPLFPGLPMGLPPGLPTPLVPSPAPYPFGGFGGYGGYGGYGNVPAPSRYPPPADPHLRFDDDEAPAPQQDAQAPPPYEALSSQVTLAAKTYLPAVAYNAAKQNFLTMISLKAPTVSGDRPQTSLDLVLVIDVSGSMAGNKIELVKDAMNFVIQNLTARDRVAIVTFDSNARRLSPLVALNPAGKDRLTEIVNQISASGGTMISTGLEIANKILNERKHTGNVASILLLSDGQDGAPQVVRTMTNAYQTHTFGFGGDHDAALLSDIATKSDGVFCFVASLQDVSPAFANCVGGLTSMFAKKLEVKVHGSEGYKLLTWRTRFTSRVNGQEALVEIPDLYSEESRDLILQLDVPAIPHPVEQDLVFTVSLSYQTTDGNPTQVNLEPLQLFLRRPEEEPKDQTVDPTLDKQNNRILSTAAMDEATKLCDGGKFREAQALLRKMIEQVKASVSGQDPLSVALVGDMEACSSRLVDRTAWESAGRAYTQQQIHQHSAQRSNYSPMSAATPMYQNATSAAWVQQQQMQPQYQPHPRPAQPTQPTPPRPQWPSSATHTGPMQPSPLFTPPQQQPQLPGSLDQMRQQQQWQQVQQQQQIQPQQVQQQQQQRQWQPRPLPPQQVLPSPTGQDKGI